MKAKTFLAKLQRNALYCLIGALLLVIGVPLYQLLILIPSGYSNTLAASDQTLRWINAHIPQFLGYRMLLVAGFALMIGLPFTLFRIIVAQEILGREEEDVGEDEDKERQGSDNQANGMPSFAWRGKGYAVLAAWAGLVGLILFAGGTLLSTIYLVSSALSLSSEAPLTGIFAIITFTAGGGLLAMSCLFFGAIIARSGRNLWPGAWVAFSYMALALAALMSASAVQVALAPAVAQGSLTTPAILLFAVWALWFGVMVVRLKPE